MTVAGTAQRSAPPTSRLRVLDVAAIALAGVFGAMIAASVFAPGIRVRLVAPDVDLVLDTVSTLVTASVAALAWARFSDSREPAALMQAVGFLVLAIANGFGVAAVVAGVTAQAGMALATPTQAPIYVYSVARLIAAGLLVAGGLATQPWSPARRPAFTLLGAGFTIFSVIALAETFPSVLPALTSTPSGAEAAGVAPPLPASTPLGAAVQIVIAGLFLWAAFLQRRLFRRDGSAGDAFIAIGLLFAAYAQLAVAVAPGVYSGLFTAADIFRLGFDLILLVAILAQTREILRDLRRANVDLGELRTREIDRAALEERARLARELHDGLAQNLWLAKLTTHRLASLPGHDRQDDGLLEELDGILDAGLAEAHEAVAALRLAGSPQGDIRELLRRLVTEFDDRFAARVKFDSDGELPSLPARTQAETLRIVHEALTNARRHADASLVRVMATSTAGYLDVTVRDNGRGFTPRDVGDDSFGLMSMRERAALVGAELRIESRPQDGTTVSLRVPVPGVRPVTAVEVV